METDVTLITAREIRAFILYLQRKSCFSEHPYIRPRQHGLSSHTIHCYLRSVRAFWSWLADEEIIHDNPFHRVKLPRVTKEVIPTFSPSQLQGLLSAIDTATAEGFRDYAMILTLLDSGLRVSELTGIRMGDIRLDDGLLKVLGKGGKERHIPIGTAVQRALWRYISRYRPQPLNPNGDFLFLTRNGGNITKSHIENRMVRYGKKAGISGTNRRNRHETGTEPAELKNKCDTSLQLK